MALNPQLAQQFQKQRAKKLQELQLRKNVTQIEKELRKQQFGGSVDEFNNFYSNLQKNNPEVAKRLSITPQSIEKVQNEQVRTIEQEIKKNEKRIEEARKDERKAKDRKDEKRILRARAEEDRYRAEIRELQRFLPRFKKGELLDEREIINFAQDMGRFEEKKTLNKKAQKPKENKILSPNVATTKVFDSKTGKLIISKDKDGNILEDNRTLQQLSLDAIEKANLNKNNKKPKDLDFSRSTPLVVKKKQRLEELQSLPEFKNLDVSKIRKDQKLSNYLNNKYQKYKQNKKGAAASIVGIGATISAGVTNTVDFAEFLGSSVASGVTALSTPKKTSNVIVNSLNNKINNISSRSIKENISLLKKNTKRTGIEVVNYFGNLGSEAQRGNPFAIAELITWLGPLNIKVPKKEDMMNNFNSFSSELVSNTDKRFNDFNSDIIYQRNINTGSSRLEIKSEGTTNNGLEFKNEIKLTENPKDKTLRGISKTKIGNNISTKNINLIDKGSFYIDKKNQLKIPKTTQKLKDIVTNINIKKENFKVDKTRLTSNFTGKIQKGNVVKEKKKILQNQDKNIEVKKTQEFEVEKALGKDIIGKNIIDFAKKKTIQNNIKTTLKKTPKKRTAKEYDNLVKVFELLDFDKKILNGIDKRTRLGYALNLNKKTLGTTLKKFEKELETGYIIKRTGKTIARGTYSRIKPKKYNLSVSFYIDKILFNNKNLNNLQGNKKAQALILSRQPLVRKTQKTKEGKLLTPQEIKIPQIDSLIYIPKKLKKEIIIPLKFKNIYNILKNEVIATKSIQKKENKKVVEKKDLSEKIKNKEFLSPKSKNKKIKPIKKPRIIIKPKKIIKPKIIKPRIKKTPKKSNVALRNHYILEFKKGKNTVRSSGEFPLNKALNRAKNLNKDEVSLILSSRKLGEDIERPQIKNFKVQRLKTKIKLLKRN